MNFRTQKIGKRRVSKDLTNFITQPLTITVLGILIVVTFLGYGLWQLIQNFSIGGFFSLVTGIVGKDLKIDRFGNTNILLLGVGGEGHEGANLTDSILIVNINHDEKIVNLISVPRDVYVDTSLVGGNRINKLYEEGLKKYGNEEDGLDFVRKTVKDLFLIDVPYAIKVDFKGFEKVIDELGGIDVFVQEPIDDPFYPDENFGYAPFYLPAGNRHLDGATALKYVRSRKTSSDFDRGSRQQQVLAAVREKAKKENVLGSTRKLKNIYNEIEPHIATNMDLREMITLAGAAKDFNENKIFTWSIHDDPTKIGGFLYTPVRELYGGAFVLLPASDNWLPVKQFLSFIFQDPEALRDKTHIQVLNGTKTPGVAAETKMILQRFGFKVSRFGNAKNQETKKTMLYYKIREQPSIIELILQLIPGSISPDVPAEYRQPPFESDASVIIELGEDFLPTFDKIDIFRNVVELKKPEEVSKL